MELNSIDRCMHTAISGFHSAHQDLYGYSYEGRELVEIVNVGVTGLGLLQRPKIPALKLSTKDAT